MYPGTNTRGISGMSYANNKTTASRPPAYGVPGQVVSSTFGASKPSRAAGNTMNGQGSSNGIR